MKNVPGPSAEFSDTASGDGREASSMGVPGPSTASAWDRLVGAIDLSRNYEDGLSHPENRLDGNHQQVGVRVSRVAGTKSFPGYWVKEIHPGHSQLAGINAWETEVLNYLQNKWNASPEVGELALKDHVVRIYSLEKRLQTPPTEFSPSALYSHTLGHETVVKTLHAGVSLDRLLSCTNCSDGAHADLLSGRVFASALAPPGNLLNVVRKTLAALQALASVHVVHCDVAFRNLAVSSSTAEPLRTDKGEAYRVHLNWSKVQLIDFGFSCHKHGHPKVFLPRSPEHPSISNRFRKLTKLIKESGQRDLLARYRGIDWREDLYQLGYELRQWLCRSTLNRASNEIAQKEVFRLLWGEHPSQGEGCISLVDELLAWGAPDQCDPLAQGVELPHQDYIDRLTRVISMLGPMDKCETLLFYRADCDPPYRRLYAEERRAASMQAELDREALEEFRQTHGSVAAMRELADSELSAVQQERQHLDNAFEALHAQQAELAEMHAERAALDQARSQNAMELEALGSREAALGDEEVRLAELKRQADEAGAQMLAAHEKLLNERRATEQERQNWERDRDQQVQSHLAEQQASARAKLAHEQAELAKQKAEAQAKSEHNRIAREAQRQKDHLDAMQSDRVLLHQLDPALAPSKSDVSLPRLLGPLPGLPIPPALVEIQGGSFIPEAPEEGTGPAALLHIGYRFAIGVFSFTQMEWLCYQNLLQKPTLPDAAFEKYFVEKGRNLRPHVGVSWRSLHDELLPWLNKRTGLSRLPLRYRLRLPTEIEWEYVARAGRSAPLSAATPAHSRDGLSPVDKFCPNVWGICGMLGNVREWTMSGFGANAVTPSAPATNLADRATVQVTRGFAWSDSLEDMGRRDRRSEDVNLSDPSLGFRLALTLPDHGVLEQLEWDDPLSALRMLVGE